MNCAIKELPIPYVSLIFHIQLNLRFCRKTHMQHDLRINYFSLKCIILMPIGTFN